MIDPNTQPDLSKYDYVIERQLKPEARRDVIAAIAARKNVGNGAQRYPHRTQRNVERGENDEQQ